MNKPHKSVSIAFLAACCIAFILSIGGVISSFWATNVDQGYDRYLTTGAGLAIAFDGRDEDYSGWYFSPIPRVIAYGNEKAVGGASVVILTLSLLVLTRKFVNGILEAVSMTDG